MLRVEKYNVRIVNTGDKYGRSDCLTNDKQAMVEFYDNRFDQKDFMGRGQFVSRYYASTLLDGEYPNGLCLDGGVPEWTVGPEAMQQVIEFIKQH
jgi:hypothetical protein